MHEHEHVNGKYFLLFINRERRKKERGGMRSNMLEISSPEHTVSSWLIDHACGSVHNASIAQAELKQNQPIHLLCEHEVHDSHTNQKVPNIRQDLSSS